MLSQDYLNSLILRIILDRKKQEVSVSGVIWSAISHIQTEYGPE